MYLMQLKGTAWDNRYRYEFNIVSSKYQYSFGEKTTIKLDKSNEVVLE